ncbi:hypothetical protein VP01_7769g1, partial [Puccinia sorghi]
MHICSCNTFECGKKVYCDDNGIKKMHVSLSNVTFQKYERLAQLNSILGPRPHGNQHQTQNQGPLSTPSGTNASVFQISSPCYQPEPPPDGPSTLPSKQIPNKGGVDHFCLLGSLKGENLWSYVDIDHP